MRFLFDTHSFIWWADEPEKLSSRVLDLCHDRSNTLVLSVASVWEIQIKQQIGKLKLKMDLSDLVASQQWQNQLELLNITLPHIFALANLPPHHRDPFDRLLIAQARSEDMPLLSQDTSVSQYPVVTIW